MLLLKSFVLICFLIYFSKTLALSCFDVISTLSSRDKCLKSRLDYKVAFASKAQTPSAFAKAVKENNFMCNGTYFACGYTTSWVTEVFEGLEQQFQECKYFDGYNGTLAGYRVDFVNLYNFWKNVPFHSVMHMRHTGTHDHVWTVEKLPAYAGYRIYQSYHDSHSLKAWLSTNLTGLFDADNGDLMLPKEGKAILDSKIRLISNGSNSLDNLTNFPTEYAFLIPYIKFVRDLNETSVINNFKKAWERYGQGKIINQSEFDNYMSELTKIVNYFNKYDNTENLFPQEIFDSWIGLFGAADPVVFPNIPTNILLKINGLTQKFRFEVMSKYLFSRNVDQDCRANANYLQGNFIF